MEAASDRPVPDQMWSRLHGVMGHVCSTEEAFTALALDDIADQAREIMVGEGRRMAKGNFHDLEACFNECEKNLSSVDSREDFERIQAFVVEEQNLGRQRRRAARVLEAAEEHRLAGEVAEIKGSRLQSRDIRAKDELAMKISDAERSYLSRKMVVAKAAHVASAECRYQFRRVRTFFDGLHKARKEALRRQYDRSVNMQAVTHRLRNTDARVAALERQIASRLYQKKRTDLNELHMVQNTEEATYLESMLDLLTKIQKGKEAAARELFQFRVSNLKERRLQDKRREEELVNLRNQAALDLAKIVAHYTGEEDENMELEEQVRENVDSMERRKDFDSSIHIMSVSQLYDTVLWSVAMSETSGSSLYSSDFDSEEDFDSREYDADKSDREGADECFDPSPGDDDVAFCVGSWRSDAHERVSCDSGSTNGSTCDNSVNTGESSTALRSRVSLPGRMHLKQIALERRKGERRLFHQHESERKAERRKYIKGTQLLKRKHQLIVEGLVQKCLFERHNLREAIGARMQSLVAKQSETTKALRLTISSDVREMRDALRSEERRVEDAEKASFIKAQELISSQVFHEVRNALSSVIAMSEMTTSLKNNPSISPQDLVSSVDGMLEQVKEVVNYSLAMLNNVLDISKVKSGSLSVENQPVDLQELVSRATRMQLAKAGSVRLSSTASPEPLIGFTNADIASRIITNFISNAIKFTSSGAIQAFVLPIDETFPKGDFTCDLTDSSSSSGSHNLGSSYSNVVQPVSKFFQGESSSLSSDDGSDTPESEGSTQQAKRSAAATQFYAVGVADTGHGLSEETLRLSEKQLSNSDAVSMVSSVRNSGFGLHLAHLLANSLGSKLHLGKLEQFHALLNSDMIGTCEEAPNSKYTALPGITATSSVASTSDTVSTSSSSSAPGRGTVLFITVPAYKIPERHDELTDLRIRSNSAAADDIADTSETTPQPPRESYSFSPRPSPTSVDGTFRILLADDVRMLRKGLVHSMVKLFGDIPISISTACTAEDMLRTMATRPYDLVISDNQFLHEPSNLLSISDEDERNHHRPTIVFDANSIHHTVTKQYFENERFSLRDGDGNLQGFDALRLVATDIDPPFPTPVLILLSGHKFNESPHPGVIVVQKPLVQSAFVALLESHAEELLQAGFCLRNCDEGDDESPRLTNRHGSQMFVAKPNSTRRNFSPD